MKYLITIIFIFFCLSFVINCAGSPSSTAASTSKVAPAYVVSGSNSGVAFVRRVGARTGVIVSGPLTGGIGYFF